MLLREVQQSLPVPIRGVISDGQHSIRNAVQTVLPEIPYQLCHFHYLREAAKPIYEADRHAKKELKKQLRGIRPIERGLEKRADPEAQAIRGYCLAVRSALTDDGRPPLSASGLKLYERMTALLASLTRVAEKRGSLAGELERLQSMLTKGVTATSSLWADVQTGYHWVYRAAHILSNEEKLKGAQVRQRYERLLAEMADVSASSEALTTMLTTFRKVTASYWPGLFHCYDVPDLPRTNNGLEHYLVRPGTLSDEQPGERVLRPVWLYADLFVSSLWLLHATITSPAMTFVSRIFRAGVLCAMNWTIARRYGVIALASVNLLKRM